MAAAFASTLSLVTLNWRPQPGLILSLAAKRRGRHSASGWKRRAGPRKQKRTLPVLFFFPEMFSAHLSAAATPGHPAVCKPPIANRGIKGRVSEKKKTSIIEVPLKCVFPGARDSVRVSRADRSHSAL